MRSSLNEQLSHEDAPRSSYTYHTNIPVNGLPRAYQDFHTIEMDLRSLMDERHSTIDVSMGITTNEEDCLALTFTTPEGQWLSAISCTQLEMFFDRLMEEQGVTVKTAPAVPAPAHS